MVHESLGFATEGDFLLFALLFGAASLVFVLIPMAIEELKAADKKCKGKQWKKF